MMIIGHRGAKGLAPENTIAGFKKALEHNVAAIEFDVRVTADGIPVIAHNSTIHDASGADMHVSKHTLTELQQHKPDIATFAETIAAINRHVPMIVEVKPGEPVAPIVAVIQSFLNKGWRPDNIVFISFDYAILKQLHQVFPDHQIIIDENWSGVRATWRARRLGSRDISLWEWVLWPGFIRAVSRRGYRLYAFPLNDPVKAKRWERYGLYGVITDYPDRFKD